MNRYLMLLLVMTLVIAAFLFVIEPLIRRGMTAFWNQYMTYRKTVLQDTKEYKARKKL